MSIDEETALTKLYRGLRNEVNYLRKDVTNLRKVIMTGFTIVFTGFVLPVGVAIIMIAVNSIGG